MYRRRTSADCACVLHHTIIIVVYVWLCSNNVIGHGHMVINMKVKIVIFRDKQLGGFLGPDKIHFLVTVPEKNDTWQLRITQILHSDFTYETVYKH